MRKKQRWGIISGATVLALTTTFAIGSTAFGEDSANRQVAQVASMAEAMYPNGATAVVVVPLHEQGLLVGAASQLSAKVHGPVLMAAKSQDLGTATWQALTALTPQAPASVQPGELLPGKPTVYLVGTKEDYSPSVLQQLKNQGYPVVQLIGNSTWAAIEAVQNTVTPPAPSPSAAKFFPQSWRMYAGQQDHNSAYAVPANAPKWLKEGVTWNFAEMNALPLHGDFADSAQLGSRGAPPKQTQYLGNSVGVTAVNGIIYAESDDHYLYALNAKTGKLLWQQGPLINSLMGDPIVDGGMVYVTAGDTGFSFSQIMHVEQKGANTTLTRGLEYSAMYAFNAKTGKPVWRTDFKGNAMSTPASDGTYLYTATGDGHMYKVNEKTGQVAWTASIGGFDSMSSVNLYKDPTTGNTFAIVGTTNEDHIIALNTKDGSVAWTQKTDLNVFNTGMGDNTASVDQTKGIVITDTVVDGNPTTKTTNLSVVALDAKTGSQLWAAKLGVGPTPPAYKAGVTMIHKGVVYVGSPATSQFFALDEKTGSILWKMDIPNPSAAGSGRGGAAFADGKLWLTQGRYILAVNPKTGQILGQLNPGGRFGIVNPVIVGGTLYADNLFDWIMAYPLKTILASHDTMS